MSVKKKVGLKFTLTLVKFCNFPRLGGSLLKKLQIVPV